MLRSSVHNQQDSSFFSNYLQTSNITVDASTYQRRLAQKNKIISFYE